MAVPDAGTPIGAPVCSDTGTPTGSAAGVDSTAAVCAAVGVGSGEDCAAVAFGGADDCAAVAAGALDDPAVGAAIVQLGPFVDAHPANARLAARTTSILIDRGPLGIDATSGPMVRAPFGQQSTELGEVGLA